MPLARTGSARVIVSALAAAALSSAMWLVFARAWTALRGRRGGRRQRDPTFAAIQSMLFGIGVLLYCLSLAVSYVLVVYEASQDAQRRGLQGQVLAQRSRAAIAPRADRSALPLQQPELDQRADDGGSAGARRMCLLLGEFLRETLALGGEDRITLSRELALLDRFLAIERVRFGDRLRAELRAGDAGGCFVPPLLLQPIVENAVTHGIAHLHRGRHHPGQRRPERALAAHCRRESVRSRSAQARAAPASGWRTCGPGCARLHGADAGLTRRRSARGLARGADAAGGHRRGIMTDDLLRVVIVDDEPLARAVVREYIKDHPGRRGRRRVRQRIRRGQGGGRAVRRISSSSTCRCRS